VIVVWHDYRNAAPDVYADRAVLDLPTEVLVSVIEGVWEPDRVRLAWHVGLSPGTSVAVYRCSPVRDWTRLGDTRVDGTGKVEFLDEGVPRGATLGYRLGFIERSGEAFAGEVWVEVPASRLAIRGGIRQRTHRGPLAVECVLRDGNTASLDLVDPAGRLRASAQIEPLGPGTHTIGLSGTESLASGVYFLRLRQSGEETRARIVLVD
jgi:hypothetical protein